jgi:AI-2E family transporter
LARTNWAGLTTSVGRGRPEVAFRRRQADAIARRFTLNPVLVILSLVFWFWMWGVPGAILAVPLLAILKIICDRLRPLKALGHFLEGE